MAECGCQRDAVGGVVQPGEGGAANQDRQVKGLERACHHAEPFLVVPMMTKRGRCEEAQKTPTTRPVERKRSDPRSNRPTWRRTPATRRTIGRARISIGETITKCHRHDRTRGSKTWRKKAPACLSMARPQRRAATRMPVTALGPRAPRSTGSTAGNCKRPCTMSSMMRRDARVEARTPKSRAEARGGAVDHRLAHSSRCILEWAKRAISNVLEVASRMIRVTCALCKPD